MSNRKCDHCHLEYDESILIEDDGLYFCCKGCQGVYHLLQDDGFDSFYDKKGKFIKDEISWDFINPTGTVYRPIKVFINNKIFNIIW